MGITDNQTITAYKKDCKGGHPAFNARAWKTQQNGKYIL